MKKAKVYAIIILIGIAAIIGYLIILPPKPELLRYHIEMELPV